MDADDPNNGVLKKLLRRGRSRTSSVIELFTARRDPSKLWAALDQHRDEPYRGTEHFVRDDFLAIALDPEIAALAGRVLRDRPALYRALIFDRSSASTQALDAIHPLMAQRETEVDGYIAARNADVLTTVLSGIRPTGSTDPIIRKDDIPMFLESPWLQELGRSVLLSDQTLSAQASTAEQDRLRDDVANSEHRREQHLLQPIKRVADAARIPISDLTDDDLTEILGVVTYHRLAPEATIAALRILTLDDVRRMDSAVAPAHENPAVDLHDLDAVLGLDRGAASALAGRGPRIAELTELVKERNSIFSPGFFWAQMDNQREETGIRQILPTDADIFFLHPQIGIYAREYLANDAAMYARIMEDESYSLVCSTLYGPGLDQSTSGLVRDRVAFWSIVDGVRPEEHRGQRRFMAGDWKVLQRDPHSLAFVRDVLRRDVDLRFQLASHPSPRLNKTREVLTPDDIHTLDPEQTLTLMHNLRTAVMKTSNFRRAIGVARDQGRNHLARIGAQAMGIEWSKALPDEQVAELSTVGGTLEPEAAELIEANIQATIGRFDRSVVGLASAIKTFGPVVTAEFEKVLEGMAATGPGGTSVQQRTSSLAASIAPAVADLYSPNSPLLEIADRSPAVLGVVVAATDVYTELLRTNLTSEVEAMADGFLTRWQETGTTPHESVLQRFGVELELELDGAPTDRRQLERALTALVVQHESLFGEKTTPTTLAVQSAEAATLAAASTTGTSASDSLPAAGRSSATGGGIGH